VLRHPNFAIILRRSNGDFIQACAQWGEDGDAELVLDFPVESETSDQRGRAHDFFIPRGSMYPEQTPTLMDGKKTEYSAWRLDLGKDVFQAAETMLDAFDAIHRPPPCDDYEVDCIDAAFSD
jgi:hypothetical protein